MGKRAFLSEFDTAQVLRRYSAGTVMGLLREVAKCSDGARLDWNVVVKKLNTGISSAKECQALWRHIAYRKELADFYPDDEQPSDDESDLEFELLPSPAVSSEANTEVVRWVKTDMQRFNIPIGGKKKGEAKSKSRDAALLADTKQGSSGVGRDGNDKGAENRVGVTAGESGTVSRSPGTACQTSLANPECALSKAVFGQSERKKRKLWSLEEDQELIAAVEKFGEGNWTNILKSSFTHKRSAAQLSQRWALIRKRRDIKAAASKPTSAQSDEQGNGALPPAADQSLRTIQNGGTTASTSIIVPPTTAVENGAVDDPVPNKTAALVPSALTASMPSASGVRRQDYASSPATTSRSNGVNGAPNGSVPKSAGVDSVTLKGGVGAPIRANGGQRQASASGAARSTGGSSTPVTSMAVDQARNTSTKISGANGGAGRLIAPGAVVMSAAAAQAVSVGQAATPPTTGAQISGANKYIVRSNSIPGSRGGSSKAKTGPDPGVQAAAVAAGARIAPASTLLKASGNVVHIRPGGVAVTKGLQSQTGMNGNGGSRGTSGAIVHYITTGAGGTPSTLLSAQRPAQQTKNQTTKASSISQTTSSVTAPNDSVSPATSNPTPLK